MGFMLYCTCLMAKMLKTKLSGLWLHLSVCMYAPLQRILLELICKELCLIGLKELNAYIKVLKNRKLPKWLFRITWSENIFAIKACLSLVWLNRHVLRASSLSITRLFCLGLLVHVFSVAKFVSKENNSVWQNFHN